MKKLKNLKTRLLSLSLAIVMVLSLAVGMAPVNVQASETVNTVNVTLDSSGFTGTRLAAIILDKNGNEFGDYIMFNNEKIVTVAFPVGGQIIVMSDNIDFEVTVTSGEATVSDPQVGPGECGYIVNEIDNACTLGINSTSQGGGTETEGNGTIQDLESIVSYDASTKKITVDLDPNKEYVLSFVPYENYAQYDIPVSRYNTVMEGEVTLSNGHKNENVLPSLTSEMIAQAGGVTSQSRYFTMTEKPEEYISGQEEAVFDVVTGALLRVCEVKDTEQTKIPYNGKNFYIVYGIHAIFVPAEETSAHTHTLTSVPEKPATCKETGYEAHYKCTDENCGKLFADAEGNEPINAPTEIDKAAHTLSAIEKNERGHWGKCSVCNVSMGDDFWEALPHIDTDSNNKCDVCDYEVYHVTLDANGYSDIMAIYVCDARDKVVVNDIRENVSFIVPKDCTVKVFGTSPIDNAVAPGAKPTPATGEDGEDKTIYIVSDFTRNTTIILNHTHGSEGTAWESDAENHWKTCDCTEIMERAAHTDANADNKCDVCEYVLHTHSLTKVPAKEATCTTDGNKEYYKCACGTLFKDAEGKNVTTLAEVKISAIGHDMTKATCTEPATCKRTGCTHTTDELGHDWSGEWTVIIEATATEEGKKETLCTRDCGQKKVVIIPKTGEVDESENLEKDAEVAPDSPIDEVTLNNTKEELLDSDIFTDKEKQDIKDGEDARVWLEVDKLDEDVIPSADKAKVEKEAEKIAGENATITYFDASLFKQIGNGKKTGIEKPGIDMKITIVIPKALLNDDDDMVREYKIIRLHKGEVDIITGEFNEETGEYSFETDRFSTYAIVYGDTPVEEKPAVPEAPKTGDVSTSSYTYALMLISGLGLLFYASKKKSNV